MTSGRPQRAARAYLASRRLQSGIGARLDVAIEGTWLGLLDEEALRALDEHYYDEVRERLDEREWMYVDDEYNLSGLMEWEAAVVEAHFPPRGRVIVTGAGGGREVIALLDRGYDAVGFEPNAGLVSAGQRLLSRREQEGRLMLSPREGFPTAAGRCDALLVGWGSYMHVVGRERRVSYLRGARGHLGEGAPVILSFFVRGPDAWHHEAVANVANRVRRLRGKPPVDVGDALEEHYVHRFTEDDIRSELTAGGFELVGFSGKPYGHAVARAR